MQAGAFFMRQRLILTAGINSTGYLADSWRHVGSPLVFAEFDHYLQTTRIAHAGRLDAVFFSDHPALGADPAQRPRHSFEPLTLSTALAVAVPDIGFETTVSSNLQRVLRSGAPAGDARSHFRRPRHLQYRLVLQSRGCGKLWLGAPAAARGALQAGTRIHDGGRLPCSTAGSCADLPPSRGSILLPLMARSSIARCCRSRRLAPFVTSFINGPSRRCFHSMFRRSTIGCLGEGLCSTLSTRSPALAQVGLLLGRVIYVEAGDEKALLSSVEGLGHGGLGVVVGELARLPMTVSRRLQLVAERSGTRRDMIETAMPRMAPSIFGYRRP